MSLLESIKNNALEEVKSWVVSHGADVNHRHLIKSPLYYAFIRGHHEIMQYLIDSGAEVNITEYDGSNMLSKETYTTNKCYQVLIDNGIDIEKRDDRGQTAIFSVRYEYVGILVKNGANINAQDNYGDTYLHKCVKTERKKVNEFLKYGADINVMNLMEETPMFGAYPELL